MKYLVDANVLINAVNEDASGHELCKSWLDVQLSSANTVGFAWQAMLAFFRVSTWSKILTDPLTVDEAVEKLSRWTAQPNAVILTPTAQHLTLVAGLLRSLGTAGNLVNDAHLAALAVEHGATVVTLDRDFARFPGVSWALPQV